jgi:hypothetical protein
MPNPTFASFLTPEGIVVAGALITGFVQLLKSTFPAIDAKVSGAVMAFACSSVIYIATTLVVGDFTPDALLLVGASWVACATASVGVYASVQHARDTN